MYCLLRHRNFDNETAFYKVLPGALQVLVLPEILLAIMVFLNVSLCSLLIMFKIYKEYAG